MVIGFQKIRLLFGLPVEKGGVVIKEKLKEQFEIAILLIFNPKCFDNYNEYYNL